MAGYDQGMVTNLIGGLLLIVVLFAILFVAGAKVVPAITSL